MQLLPGIPIDRDSRMVVDGELLEGLKASAVPPEDFTRNRYGVLGASLLS